MSKFNKNDLNTFHWEELEGAELEGKYDMPKLEPVHDGVPENLVPFHIAVSRQNMQKGWYHFYEDDYQFERFWNNPDKYIPKLKEFPGGITTDFSVYLDMPKGQQVWNCWRNRVMAYYMQKNGLKVIPNVSWSDYESLSWAFDGLPENSILAVTSQGCMKSDYVCKQSFLNGMHELVSQKHPEMIIVYGLFPELWMDRFSVPIVTYKTFSQERWGK
jgi:hypothetical protein